jgi:hypothetical protein
MASLKSTWISNDYLMLLPKRIHILYPLLKRCWMKWQVMRSIHFWMDFVITTTSWSPLKTSTRLHSSLIGGLSLGGHAIWAQECSTNLSIGGEYNFQGLSWNVHETNLGWLSMFSNLDTHLPKLWLCFDKCKEFDISLNPKKCMFLMHLNVILGYMVSKGSKPPNLKKNSTIIHMLTSKTPKDIQVFNGMTQYYQCFIKDFAFIMAPKLL